MVVVVVVVVEHFTVAPIKTTIVISTVMLYVMFMDLYLLLFVIGRLPLILLECLFLLAGICSLLLFFILAIIPAVVIVIIAKLV